jgi:hypothetical protein
MDERRSFIRFMREFGTPAPLNRRMEIQPEITPGETDCWTHAYRYALAHPGGRYVEGICFTDREDGKVVVHAHAWIEEDTPFGTVLVELTDGYQHARDYRGWALDLDTPQAARAVDDSGLRYSIIELDIAIREEASS